MRVRGKLLVRSTDPEWGPRESFARGKCPKGGAKTLGQKSVLK